MAAVGLLPLTGCITDTAGVVPQPFPEGLYGNVELSRESGDLGGFEVRFYTDAANGKPMAEFTMCEGWCNAVYTAEVIRRQQGFAFSHIETLETYTDSGAVVEEAHLVEYSVTPAGRGWKVGLNYDGNDVTAGEPWRIVPLKRPFGLEVARREGAPSQP